MNGKSLAHAMLRSASLLAPAGRRAEWLKEWRSELWYIPPDASARFCLGAFRDAIWVRRNQPRPRHLHLESPLSCLAFLAGVASLALLIAICLPAPELPDPPGAHLTLRDLPGGCLASLAMSLPWLAAIWAAMGPAQCWPRPGRLRLALFLLLKLALVQPVFLTSFIILLLTGPSLPILPQLLLSGTWGFSLRWILHDQQRRCPVCLRLLTEPVRIGSASETFLEWYGAESACSRGHGLLQVPETSATYAGARQWLALDASWNDLFSEAAERR
jgi:hypothetical protein